MMNYSAKTLFLIDAIGALITALLLSQIVARFVSFFGMPQNVVYLLAGIACVFAIYSALCHLLINNNFSPFLVGIAIANTLYCLLTAGLVIHYWYTISIWGVAYFVGEIIVVLTLVYVEYRQLRSE